MSFIQNCERALTKQLAKNNFNGFVVLPYDRAFPRKKVAFQNNKSLQTTANHQQPFSAPQRARRFWPLEIRYSVQNQLQTVYYGQTERSLKTWVVEHKKAVADFDQNSNSAITWTLQTLRSLVSSQIATNDFSLKPGTLLWTRTLGMITSYFQKPTKSSREHETLGHARKLRVTLL